jgi:hypothetical protein
MGSWQQQYLQLMCSARMAAPGSSDPPSSRQQGRPVVTQVVLPCHLFGAEIELIWRTAGASDRLLEYRCCLRGCTRNAPHVRQVAVIAAPHGAICVEYVGGTGCGCQALLKRLVDCLIHKSTMFPAAAVSGMQQCSALLHVHCRRE